MAHANARVAMVSDHLGKEAPVVTLQRNGPAGIITLNRPKALNSLSFEMLELLGPAFKACEDDPECKFVILKGEGRAFCAGGDVVALATAAKDPQQRHKSVNLFKLEYECDRYIAHMKKPLISLLNGITMGGGAGLSVHGSFRVATDKTVFAMPETGIGLFPDVGANFFLPRLDGEVGTYLALTSERLTGYSVYRARIATHYIPCSKINELEQNLLNLDLRSSAASSISATIDACIEGLASSGETSEDCLYGWKRTAVDRCFGHNKMEEIMDALKETSESISSGVGAKERAWAKKTLETLEMKSPTSMKVTLAGLRKGRDMGINDVLQMDMEIGEMCCNSDIVPDFAEGVTHLLVKKRKDRASWSPSTIHSTPDSQIQSIFFSSSRSYTQLSAPGAYMKNYKSYPHANFGLPSEKAILERLGKTEGRGKKEVVQWAKETWPRKKGVEEVVEEVLERRGPR